MTNESTTALKIYPTTTLRVYKQEVDIFLSIIHWFVLLVCTIHSHLCLCSFQK